MSHTTTFDPEPPPTPLDLSMLGPHDASETHDGITWVWFHVVDKWQIKRAVVIFRIVSGMAKIETGAVLGPEHSVQVHELARAWERLSKFLAANYASLVWRDYGAEELSRHGEKRFELGRHDFPSSMFAHGVFAERYRAGKS